MKAGIVGLGYVGGTIHRAYKKHKIDVNTFDINKDLQPTHSQLSDFVRDSDIVYIAVPTPQSKDGSCDTSIVEGVIKQISAFESYSPIIVIKSTVSIGSTNKLQEKYPQCPILFSPEFLREATADQDFANQPMMLVGYTDKSYRWAEQIMLEQQRITTSIGYMKCVPSTTAEMYKYVANAFLATKVSFANEMYDTATYNEVDWSSVANLLKQDVRLGETHWDVPGPDGLYGYGGNCFPKDVNALIQMAPNQSSPILKAIELRNTTDRKNL